MLKANCGGVAMLAPMGYGHGPLKAESACTTTANRWKKMTTLPVATSQRGSFPCRGDGAAAPEELGREYGIRVLQPGGHAVTHRGRSGAPPGLAEPVSRYVGTSRRGRACPKGVRIPFWNGAYTATKKNRPNFAVFPDFRGWAGGIVEPGGKMRRKRRCSLGGRRFFV